MGIIRIRVTCRFWNLNSICILSPSKTRTVCTRSSDPFYLVTYYAKCVTISWTDGTCNLRSTNETIIYLNYFTLNFPLLSYFFNIIWKYIHIYICLIINESKNITKKNKSNLILISMSVESILDVTHSLTGVTVFFILA